MKPRGIALVLLWSLLGQLACTPSRDNRSTMVGPSDKIERVTEKGPIKLTVRLTPAKPRLSDLVDLEIDVESTAKIEIHAPSFGQSVGDFLVRDYQQPNDARSARKEGAESGTRKIFRYQLEPVHTGKHLIRAVAIDFIDQRPDSENYNQPSSIESEPIELEITSELGEGVPNLADLDPMLPPRPLQSSRSLLWFLLILPIILIATLFLAVRRKGATKVIEPPRKSPWQLAYEALEGLLAENLPALGRMQEFYLRLTGIVRQYIEDITGVRAPEQTTEEFLEAMRNRGLFPADQSVRLKDFLEAADMVKFAGQLPTSEQIDMSILRAREFIAMHSLRPNLAHEEEA